MPDSPSISVVGPSAPSFALQLPSVPGLTFFALSSNPNAAGGGAAGVSLLNSLTGVLNVVGAGNISVTTDGLSQIFVSGNNVGGAITQSQLDSLSGWAAATTGLRSTGSILYSLIVGLSGSNATTYATLLNVTQSGVQLGSKIDSVSGWALNFSGFNANQIALTGQQAWNAANSNAINLSGNITQTGIQLGAKIDLVSGWTQTVVSGGLEARILATGNSVVTHANSIGTSLSGNLTQTGIQALNFAAGIGTIISGNLTSTGVQLGSKIDSLSGWTQTVVSGGVEARITATGNSAVTHANSIGATLSGNLTQTGIQALNFAAGIGTIISGNLTSTGVQLGAKIDSASGWVINTVSGSLEVRITATGNSAVAQANSIGSTLSGNLTQSGIQALNYSNGIGTIISGNLTSTGLQLSAVKVSGSSVINIANFTGLGGTLVFWSGNQIFISGGAGGGGGGVPSVNGITSAVTVQGTGGLTAITVGQSILISGDNSISGALISVSGALAAQIASNAAGVGTLNGLSGSLNLIGTGGTISVITSGISNIFIAVTGIASLPSITSLSGNMTQTGVQALAYAAGIGSIISGNLTQTGVALGLKIDNASGYVESMFVHRTGNEFVTGIKTWQSELRFNGGLKTPLKFFGDANYTLASGDYIVIATGSVANVTGILPSIASYSGNLFTIINNRTLTLPISGVIGPDTNPNLQPYDAIQIYGGSGVWHYIRQTGSPIWSDQNANAVALSGALTQTGIQALAYANGIGTIISGNLTSTGVQAFAFANGIGTIISGNLTLTGVNLMANDLNISGNMARTGATLMSNDLNISGSLTQTGIQALAFANGIGTIISGNLTSTGVQLGSKIDSASGWTINTVSGGLELRIIATGNSVVTHANSIGTTLSGNLTQTGIQTFSYANGIGTIISGNLTQTGVQLLSKINSLSGFVTGMSGALNALIAGGGTQVRITGSSTLSIADFTGIGGAIVFISGGQVFISGGAGGGVGGGSTVTVTGSSALASADFSGLGGVTVSQNGSKVLISGSAISINQTNYSGETHFITGLQTGFNTYFIAFNPNFDVVPHVQLTQESAVSDSNYPISIRNRTTSGVYIFLTDVLAETGFYLNVLAQTSTGASAPTTSFVSNSFNALQVTGNFSIVSGNFRYIWTGVANATGTMPNPVGAYSGIEVYIKNKTASFSVLISGNIDNQQNATLAPFNNFVLWSDGQTWNRE